MFEITAASKKWTNAQDSFALLTSISGKALSELPNLAEEVWLSSNFRLIETQLTALFSICPAPHLAALKLATRRQTSHESIHEFALAVSSLAGEAYPNNALFAKRQEVDTFIAGLRDTQLSRDMFSRAGDFQDVRDAETHANQVCYFILK